MYTIRILILILLIIPVYAFGASSYYVDNSVGSSGNGSSGSPWKEFSDINWTTIGSASKPCTIYISGGASGQTYSIAVGSSIGAAGSDVGSEVILKRPTETEWAGHSGKVIFQNSNSGGTLLVINKSYVTIDGFELKNSGGSVLCIGDDATVTYITVKNCWLHDWSDAGIWNYNSSSHPATYVTIQNNRIGPPNTAPAQDPIILGWNDHWVIEKNIIEYRYDITSESHADGIHFQDAATNLTIRYNWFRGGFKNAAIFLDAEPGNNDTGPMNADIYGNIFENCYDPGNNGWQGILWYHAGNYKQHILNIYNNVFANLNQPSDGSGFAIWAHSGATSSEVVRIENNIFYNAKIGIESGNDTTNYTLNNNWYYNNDGVASGLLIEWKGTNYTSIATFYGATGQESTKHQSDPQLTTLNHTFNTTHDFRPAVGSPVINAGTDKGSSYNVGISTVTAGSDWPYYAGTGSPGTGVTTISRPQGAAWDIGAYEWITEYTFSLTIAGTGTGTVTSSPAGINHTASTTYDWDDGTEVTLTAYPAYGSSFTGWSGTDCSGSSTCVVTMSQARDGTATFNLTGTMVNSHTKGAIVRGGNVR